MNVQKEGPLMRVVVVHSLPGRIRVRSRALRYLSGVKQELIAGLLKSSNFYEVAYTPQTCSLLVKYDQQNLTTDDVVEILESHIGSFSLIAFQKDRESKNELTVSERRLQEESVENMLKRIVISLGALILFSIKKIGTSPLEMGVKTWKSHLISPESIISLVLSGPIIKSGYKSLLESKRPNADTLTTAAILTAILTGRGTSALMTILLSDIAELMTAYTMERTRRAISDMLSTGDESLFVLEKDGSLVLKKATEVLPGEIISVQNGDKLSVDGIISQGEAYIDQASITGEFFPILKKKGESVFAGTILKSGQLRVMVERVGDKTTVARIVHMVEEAASKKAQIQAYADRFSAHLIPLNFGLAAIVYLMTKNVDRALSMMIIDYSCGVRLSTATALSACIHNAARNGVLIKGGNYVEALATADALVLDKTGTITEGRPKIMSIQTAEGVQEQILISLAAAAEEESSHPVAHAILEKARRMGVDIPKHGLVTVDVGRGVKTHVEEALVLVGNRKYMRENGIELGEILEHVKSLEQKGESVIYIARDSALLGIIGIHDALKENMKKSLNRLRNLGFDDIRLLTGDLAFQAEKVASRMHMDDYQAELLPEDKARTVLQMQSNGSRVIMIGDGINDAPALAYSDVGIAIGNTRTDVAIESSNVTITNDDPLLIPSAIQLSRKTMRVVKQNFALVVGINTLGIIFSAAGLMPVLWSSVLHNSSTIFVVMNSGRLLIQDFERRSYS